jgi:hypothetical protein
MKLHPGYFIIISGIIFLCPFQIKVIQMEPTVAEPKGVQVLLAYFLNGIRELHIKIFKALNFSKLANN